MRRLFCSRLLRIALPLIVVLLTSLVTMQAQIAHFGGAAWSGFSGPAQIAIDSKGNIFIADSGNNTVKEIVATNGVVSPSTVPIPVSTSTTFSYPAGVAVDGSGNIFVADSNDKKLKEFVATNGVVSPTTAPITLGGTTLNYPEAVAVDGSGDVFVADYYAGKVYKIVVATNTISVLGSGFSYLTGIAVDSNGNVFVSEPVKPAVEEIPAGGGSPIVLDSTIFIDPYAVTVDVSGDVFVADGGTVKEIVATGGAITSSSPVKTLYSNLGSDVGVAVDSSGNVYVTIQSSGKLEELTQTPTNFGTIPVASSVTATLNVYFGTPLVSTGSLIGAPAVLTQGASGLDFADTGTGTCATNGTSHAYLAGSSCTIVVTFTPKHPGLRMGAVQLLDNTGAVVATQAIYGIGTGPQITYPPNTSTLSNMINPLGSGFPSSSGPDALAVDGNGDVFVADNQAHVVEKIVASGGKVSSTSTIQTVGTGFPGPNSLAPYGAAVDGSGNVFVADFNNHAVYEIIAVGGVVSSTSTVQKVGSGFNIPTGVAVDGSGDVFVADSGNKTVYEIVAVGGVVSSTSTVKTLASGLGGPYGIAVDSSGNVFVADEGSGQVKEIVAGSGTANAVGSGFSFPTGIAVDSNGNVFVADNGTNTLYEIVAVGGMVSSTSTVKTVANGSGDSLWGVALDGSGNIFVADPGARWKIGEIDLADPPSLTFASTKVGNTSSDSPQTVTIANSGNAALTFAVPASGSNLSISANFNLSSSSTCPELTPSSSVAMLAANTSCIGLVSFVPTTVGTISGSLVSTDNNLNAVGSVQTIPLSGVATAVSTTTKVTGTPSPSSFGQAVTFTATVAPKSGVALPAGTVQFSVDGTDVGRSVTLDSSGMATFTSSTLAVGTHSITAVYTPDSTNFKKSTAKAFSQTVTKALLTVTANNLTMTYGTAVPALTAAYSGFVNGDTAATTFSVPPTLTSTATVLSPVGTYPITASGAVASNYTITYVTGALTISQATQTVTFVAPSAVTYGVAPITLTGTASSGFPVTYTVTGPATISGSVLTITGAGAVVVTASQTGSPSYAAATPVSQTITSNKAVLTVTAANQTRAYGAADPTFTYTITGFQNSDSPATSTTGTPSLTSTDTGTSPVSPPTYPITVSPSNLVAANYTFTFVSGALTITQATQTLTFTAPAMVTYGVSPITLSSTSTSGLPVTYTVTGPATLSGSVLTITGAGTVVVTANQTGNANYSAATPITQTIMANKASTTPVMTVNPTSPTYGAPVTVTVTMPSAPGGAAPTGTVTIYDNSIAVGTDTLDSNGAVTVTLPGGTLTTGSSTITVGYPGDGNYGSSSSGTTVTVTSATTPDFIVGSTTPSLMVNAGSAATYTITVSPIAGMSFTNPVTLTASGMPAGFTASFFPVTVTPGSGTVASKMTVQTYAAPMAALKQSQKEQRSVPSGVIGAVLLLPLLGVRKWRKKLPKSLLYLLLLSGVFGAINGLSGCGGGYFGSDPTIYTLTVTGNSGSVQHSTMVTLRIQ